MLHRIVAAGFENMVESDDVAFDVHVGTVYGISHARLRRKVHHNRRFVFFKQAVH